MSVVADPMAGLDPDSRELLRQSIQLHRGGRAAAAEAGYRELLRRAPEHPELLTLLGTLLLQTGRGREAERILGRARRAAPGRRGLSYSYAMAAEAAGEPEAAVAAYREAIVELPREVEIRFRLAQLLAEMGRSTEAVEVIEAALGTGTQDAGLLNNAGRFFSAIGDVDRASACFESALEIAPDFHGARTNLAMLQIGSEQLEAAQSNLERVLSADPSFAPAWVAAADASRQQERWREAETRYKRALSLQPGVALVLANLAFVLDKAGKKQESAQALDRALTLAPKDPSIHKVRGYALFDRGDVAGSEAAFRRAIELRPTYGDALVGLVNVLEYSNQIEEAREALERATRYSPEHAMLGLLRGRLQRRDGDLEAARASLESGLSRVRLSPVVERNYHYEYGKVLDALNEPAAAYQAFVCANDAARQQFMPEDLGDNPFLSGVKDQVEVMSEEWVAGFSELPDPAPQPDWPAPVFLVGFPRSGTTLLDQILDAHPDVKVFEEEPWVSHLFRKLKDFPDGYPESVRTMTEAQRDLLRTGYRTMMSELVDPGDSPVFIDKLPLAATKAMMLARLFPEARFILAVRHPADCCLSAFMQDFGFNAAMANFYDMESTVETYDAVMSAWRGAVDFMDVHHHRIRYEDVVEDLESEARAVLEFLGLEFDPVVLDHVKHAKQRGRINTPSYHQVSQPIYRTARFRWERYREQLAPYLPQLEPWIRYHGYPAPDAEQG